MVIVVSQKTVEISISFIAFQINNCLNFQETVDTNPERELLVVLRPLKVPGRGKHRSGLLLVTRSVEVLWYTHDGLSLQLTACRDGRLEASV